MTFKELGLSKPLLKAVEKKGYKKPSIIQEKAIPIVLERKDILASAQTGTGKTAGFVLPILQILNEKQISKDKQIRCLIVTPTRELAAQIYDNIKAYSLFMNLKSTVIFGGVKQVKQVAELRKGIDILVATPGRLLDLENQGIISLSKIEIVVLDEADRMLDMGFLRDIKKILALMPKKKQSLLFSATFSKDIRKLATSFLFNPVSVSAAPENTTADKINQKIYKVDKSKKSALIIKLITEGNWKQVLVFTRTKHGANRLCKKLINKNISAAAIHGNKTQNARVKALSSFKEGKIRVLVATDIAARGLDIPLLPHVINFELPNIAEDYVHRIGRTGRAGASGEAISLVCADEAEYVKSIEKLLKIKLKAEIVKDFEPVDIATTKSTKKATNTNQNRQRKPKKKKWKNKNTNSQNNTSRKPKAKKEQNSNNNEKYYGKEPMEW